MNWPTWTSLGEAAANSLPTWKSITDDANLQIRFQQELASVRASWFAVENPQGVEAEAKRRLMEKLQRGG